MSETAPINDTALDWEGTPAPLDAAAEKQEDTAALIAERQAQPLRSEELLDLDWQDPIADGSISDEPEPVDVAAEPEAKEDAPAPEAAEDEKEATPVEPPPAVAPEVLQTIGARLGSHLESPDDLTQAVEALVDERDGLAYIKDTLARQPAIAKVLQAALDEKGDVTAAVLEAFPDLTLKRPDPDEDPEAYARYEVRMAEERVRREYAEKEARAEEERMARVQTSMQRTYEAFAERMKKVDEAFDPDAFAQEYTLLVRGDGRKARSDMFDVVYRGLNHEALLKKAVEAAKIEGRNEAINQVTKRRNQPVDPAVRTARTPAGETSKAEAERQRMRRSFAQDGHVDLSWRD